MIKPPNSNAVAVARQISKALKAVDECPPKAAGAVDERVAAARLGVSVDVLRKDRWGGKLGIPYIKIGEGKRGLVRYDLADLDRWVETKKRVGRATQVPRLEPVEQAQAALQPAEPSHPVEPWTELPKPPRTPRQSRSPWDAMIQADPPDDGDDFDPFTTAGRSAPRRRGSGYWGH